MRNSAVGIQGSEGGAGSLLWLHQALSRGRDMVAGRIFVCQYKRAVASRDIVSPHSENCPLRRHNAGNSETERKEVRENALNDTN